MSQQIHSKPPTANAVWIATAILHMENKLRKNFQGKEIFNKVKELKLLRSSDATLRTHISHHCVANSSPSPNRDRKLFRESGGYRLYKDSDLAHSKRENGQSAPAPENIPEKYRKTLEWYHKEYNNYSEKVNGLSGNSDTAYISTIDDDNRAKIPKGIIDMLKPKKGEVLLFQRLPDGNIMIKKAST